MDLGASQCGYCTSGMLLSAKALIEENPSPTTGEIREALSGNAVLQANLHLFLGQFAAQLVLCYMVEAVGQVEAQSEGVPDVLERHGHRAPAGHEAVGYPVPVEPRSLAGQAPGDRTARCLALRARHDDNPVPVPGPFGDPQGVHVSSLSDG
jgi:hypothetical protein